MSHFESFGAAIGPWQNFYILVGTASATLIGLMFIAITFGSRLVTAESVAIARAFYDPVLAHFAQVLIVACVMLMPTMDAAVAGALLLAICAVRLFGMVAVYRQMAAAQQRSNDIELSDWLTSIAIPGIAHLAMAASGAAFLAGDSIGFTMLAAVTIVVLINALYAAWEMIVWLAVKRPD